MKTRHLVAVVRILTSLAITAHAATITVTTTNDSGAGSLRQAILTANNSTNVPDTIAFNITGTGPFTITPATGFTNITDPVTIDGYTQPGAVSNTSVNADNAVLKIKLVGGATALSLNAGNCTMRGLVVVGEISLPAHTPGGNVIEGNFFGVDFDGVTPIPATIPCIHIDCSNNRFGGTNLASRNIVAYHNPGVELFQNNDDPTYHTTNNVIQGNFIGVDATGINPAGNGARGVQISMAPTNLVGGTTSGAANLIGFTDFSGVGINDAPGNKVLGNSIFHNGEVGIFTPNAIVTNPSVNLASNTLTSTIITGTFANLNTTVYRLEFFSSATSNNQGRTLIATTNLAGASPFTLTVPRVASSLFITATATGPETSKFSDAVPVITPGSAGPTNSWTNNVSGKWEGDFNWSRGIAPNITHSAILITNAVTKTITNDTTTALDFTGTMSISNLTIGAPIGSTNTLLLLNTGTNTPLRIFRSLIVTNGGAMTLTNAILQVDGLSNGVFKIDGPVTLSGGSLIVTNSSAQIGVLGRGSLNLSNATAYLNYPQIGNFAGSHGSLTAVGGSVTVTNSMYLAFNAGTTGTVWLAGSQLEVKSTLIVGLIGTGQFTASNSVVQVGAGLSFGSVAGARGSFSSVGSTNRVIGNLTIGDVAGTTGTVFIGGGQLVVTNGSLVVGNSGSGQLTVSNTTLLTGGIVLGKNPGSAGTFELAGGTMIAPNLTSTGSAFGATSTLLVSGGQLIITNPTTLVSTTGLSRLTLTGGIVKMGFLNVRSSGAGGIVTVAGGTLDVTNELECIGTGVSVWVTGGLLAVTNLISFGNTYLGQAVVSNGSFVARDFWLGNGSSAGTLTVAGGAFSLPFSYNGLTVGNGATGTIWQTGGQIVLAKTTLSIGGLFGPYVGFVTGSNGTLFASNVFVAAESSGRGTFNINGATNHVYASLTLGDEFCIGTGIVNMTSGRLYVTNAAGNATLEVRSGTLNLSGGLLQANKIVITNACAHFVNTGATVQYNTVVIPTTGDMDADGIPNSYEFSHGLNPLDPADANSDSDGDGRSALEEYLAGTDPANSTSAFRITSVVRSNDNIRITWTTVGGKTNRVLVGTAIPGGEFTNEFSNLSSLFIIPGSGDSSTNFIDIGGATNVPSRYYRIRLIP